MLAGTTCRISNQNEERVKKVKRDTVVLLVESRVRMEKESKVKKARHNNRERTKKNEDKEPEEREERKESK